MCKSEPTQLKSHVHQAAASTSAAILSFDPPPQGSRRRRLWELDGHAHCPVIGVCLPIAALRRLVGKVRAGRAVADECELHTGAVAECKRRTPIAQAVQRELDRRNTLPLRQAAKAKTTEALAAWWQEASQGKDLAGAFWATLTHARCTPTLEHQVLGEVHMLQHQVGMARRVDLQRLEELIAENGVLTRELADAQQRSTRQARDHMQRSELLQSLVMQMRAQLVARDTSIAALQEDLQTLQAAAPGLKGRFEQACEIERLVERNHELQRSLLQSQQAAERLLRRADGLAAEPWRRAARTPDAPATARTGGELLALLASRAVLCVGGRPASVPIYRQLIEGTGGRFMHHDGGDEDNAAKLDAMVAAADLVICQTGCISHNAYWRVKDHCKRTGKRCVFVESPSRAGLKRALSMLGPALANEASPDQPPQVDERTA